MVLLDDQWDRCSAKVLCGGAAFLRNARFAKVLYSAPSPVSPMPRCKLVAEQAAIETSHDQYLSRRENPTTDAFPVALLHNMNLLNLRRPH
jgi:hypothetical protein